MSLLDNMLVITRSSLVSLKHPVGAGYSVGAGVGAGVGAAVGTLYRLKEKNPPQISVSSPAQAMSHVPMPLMLKSTSLAPHQHCVAKGVHAARLYVNGGMDLQTRNVRVKEAKHIIMGQ